MQCPNKPEEGVILLPRAVLGGVVVRHLTPALGAEPRSSARAAVLLSEEPFLQSPRLLFFPPTVGSIIISDSRQSPDNWVYDKQIVKLVHPSIVLLRSFLSPGLQGSRAH